MLKIQISDKYIIDQKNQIKTLTEWWKITKEKYEDRNEIYNDCNAQSLLLFYFESSTYVREFIKEIKAYTQMINFNIK